MRILVLSSAEEEFAEVVDYYNEQRPGLGFEFAAEVQRTFERIRHHPKAWPVFSSQSRRCLTDRFPFGVLIPSPRRLHSGRSHHASQA